MRIIIVPDRDDVTSNVRIVITMLRKLPFHVNIYIGGRESHPENNQDVSYSYDYLEDSEENG